jgi:hypothetical protein
VAATSCDCSTGPTGPTTTSDIASLTFGGDPTNYSSHGVAHFFTYPVDSTHSIQVQEANASGGCLSHHQQRNITALGLRFVGGSTNQLSVTAGSLVVNTQCPC